MATYKMNQPDVQAMFERMNRVEEAALDVWKSDDAVDRFMNRPHMLLGDKTPADVTVQDEEGAEKVIWILGCLKHGTAV